MSTTDTKYVLAYAGKDFGTVPMAIHFIESADGKPKTSRLLAVTPDSFENENNGLAVYPTQEAAEIAKDILCRAALNTERTYGMHRSNLNTLADLQPREYLGTPALV